MALSSTRPAYARPALASLRASVASSAVRWLPSSWPSCSLEAVCLVLTSSLRSSPSLASAQLPCWAQKPKDEPSNTRRRYKDRAQQMILGKGKQEMRGQASMYNLHNQLVHWATIAPEQICI